MAVQQTLVLIKPGAVERGLIGEVIARYERKGLRIIALQFLTMSHEIASQFYEMHRDKSFFHDLLQVMTAGSLVAMILEGEEAIDIVRLLNGATNPMEAFPGTIRGDFGTSLNDNVVHGADSEISAKREIKILFRGQEEA